MSICPRFNFLKYSVQGLLCFLLTLCHFFYVFFLFPDASLALASPASSRASFYSGPASSRSRSFDFYFEGSAILPATSSSAPPIIAEASGSEDEDFQAIAVPFRSGNSDVYLPMISLDDSWFSDTEFRFVVY